ncbi:PcfJ domain-containing protein [Gimesia maris]|uniref:PcfJ domain-containing protein n=1 Tax=Gimesia maris TaxID=122 RepID=UPI0030DDC78A|tara:strand:- start:103109 stop:104584 length:1476 start_codon:yes stop_codon:yes gene_type:complete
MSCRKGTSTKQSVDPELLAHLQSLNLKTIGEYRQWCVENGFRTGLRKSRRQRCEEMLYFRRRLAVKCLQQRKQEQRSMFEKLDAVCSANIKTKSISDPLLRNISELYQYRSPILNRSELIRDSFIRLISQLYCSKSKIIDAVQTGIPWDCFSTALVFIAAEARSWIRPVEKWRPRGSNVDRQLASLLRHLFVKYRMPLFFDSVWLLDYSPHCAVWRDWYLEVGQGQNIRHCALPISYTKKMAHYFMRAPQDLSLLQAIRWGQILGMGGDARLARMILSTRLTPGFSRDEFWSVVIQWLILHPQLELDQLRLIVDYLIFQRYGVSPEEYDEDSSPINEYSLKGRTFQSLLRDVNEWHRDQENKKRIPEYEWEPSGIPEFDFRDEEDGVQSGKRWVIRELLNSYELDTEGNHMNHCVGTYASSCVEGNCSIWSMQIELETGFKKAITIEVRKEPHLICEVRGKANRLPNPRERNVLRRWAETAGLKFSSYCSF